MDLYLRHQEEFAVRYNCSILSEQQWTEQNHPNIFVGVLCLGLGCMYLVLYIPCLIVMRKPSLYSHSCYKMMFSLGILDCCSVVYNCILGGVFSIIGAVACPMIGFHYIIGATSIGVWIAQCSMCVLLALNRCSDLYNISILKRMYAGKKVYFVIALPFIYCALGVWFGRGALFTSKAYAYFFDPYFMIEEISVDRSYYTGYLLSINNITVTATLIILHAMILIAVWANGRGSQAFNLSKIQRQLCIQAFCVCSLNFLAASIYVYMQFLYTPYFLILLAEFTWQGSTGGAVFTYLILNRTIRRGVLSLLTPKRLFHSTVPTHPHNIGQNNEQK